MSIISKSLLNGKHSDNNFSSYDEKKASKRLSLIKFFCLPGISTLDFTDKDEFKAEYKPLAKGTKNWVLKDGFDSLVDRINAGNPHQVCYGTDKYKANAIYSDFFVIDVDNWDKEAKAPISSAIALKEILNNSFIKNYFQGYQLSFTQNSDEYPNVHLYGIYNETCSDVVEREVFLRTLSQYLRKVLATSSIDACIENNPTQVIFSGKTQFERINAEAFINIAEFLELHKDIADDIRSSLIKKTERKAKTPNPESKGISRLEHIRNAIIDEKLEGDWSKVFCLIDHKFQVKKENQLDGLNPFSETNNSGTSFTITLENDEQPPVWSSRCGVPSEYQDAHNNSNGGDVIAYWLMVHRVFAKEQGRINPFAKAKTIKQQYAMAYDDICKFFGVQPLDFTLAKANSINNMMLQVCEDLQNVLFSVEWGDTAKDNTHTYYYKNGSGFFITYSLKKLSLKIVEYLDIHYPDFEPAMIERSLTDKNFKWKGLNQEITNWFNNNHAPLNILTTRPNWKTEYIPFENGLYHTRLKKLEENNGQAFNTGIISKPFMLVEDSHPGVVAFKKWITEWLDTGCKSDYITNYIIIAAQGRANEVSSFPCIFGKKGTGKSTLGSIVTAIFPHELGVCLTNSKQPLNPNNNHGEAELENKFIWTIKEISQHSSSSMDKLLDFFGEDNDKEYLTINPKGREQKQISKLFGLIADSEKIPQLPKAKKGYYRRFVFIESSYAPQVVDYIKIIKEYSHEVYCWLIAQDFDKAKATLLEALKDEYFMEKTKEVQKENSDLAQFVERCFEVTNTDEDKHQGQDIFRLYMQWCTIENMRSLDSRVFAKFFKSSLEDFDWNEKTTRTNGKTLYRGLKLREDVLNYNFVQSANQYEF
jgi:energy-coupling factor transporter ATP-binding protein EcfA2